LILDSSAIVAVILRERGHDRLVKAMDRATGLAVGAPTMLETGIVMVRAFDMHGRSLVSRFLRDRDVVVTPFDSRHWSVATEAFIQFGKGRHPARLNYGDCMTYATARVADAPLLFVGDDFAKTDLTPALA
jgi:ribonuclease VapC